MHVYFSDNSKSPKIAETRRKVNMYIHIYFFEQSIYQCIKRERTISITNTATKMGNAATRVGKKDKFLVGLNLMKGSVSMCLSIQIRPFQLALVRRNPPASQMQETWVQSLGQQDPLEKKRSTNSSILPGEIHGRRSPWGHKELDTTESCSDLASKQQQH